MSTDTTALTAAGAILTESKIVELRERVARANRCACPAVHELYDVPMSAGELRVLLDTLAAARESAVIAATTIRFLHEHFRSVAAAREEATRLEDALADLLGAECLCPVRVDGTCNTVRHNTARAALAASSGAVVGET